MREYQNKIIMIMWQNMSLRWTERECKFGNMMRKIGVTRKSEIEQFRGLLSSWSVGAGVGVGVGVGVDD